MARVKGPLMSIDARGELAAGLRFRGGASGRVHVYLGGDPHSRSAKRVSPKQQQQRAAYRAAVAQWRELSADQKADWALTGRSAGLTGFAAFLSFAMGGGEAEPQVQVPIYPAAGLTVALELGALTDNPGALEVAW